MTTEEVYAFRREHGFVSPMPPLERGDMLLCYTTRGGYEWLVHVDDVSYLAFYGVKIDGVTYTVTVGESWPFMNATMISASTRTPDEGYIVPGAA